MNDKARAAHGYNDYPLSDLRDVELAPAYARKAAGAVGQLVIATPRGARLSPDQRRLLVIPTIELRNRKFLNGYPLFQDTRADIAKFFDQYTIKASTATLVGPAHILTARHAIVEVDIRSGNMFFIPYRTNLTPVARARGGASLKVSRQRYFRICEIADFGREPDEDWALLKLELPADDIEHLEIAGPDDDIEDVELYTLTHPLGLPLKYSKADLAPAKHGRPCVLSDFGSGSSGAPLIGYQEASKTSKVWAVIVGNTRFVKNQCRATTSGMTIDPHNSSHATPQPITIPPHSLSPL